MKRWPGSAVYLLIGWIAVLALVTGCAERDRVFPPVEPGLSVTVLTPNGGETWQATSSQTIRYTATDPDVSDASLTISLSYSTDGGNAWLTILADSTNTGQHAWTVPDISTSTARVRVSANNGQKTEDDSSNGNFTISQGGPGANTLSVGTALGESGSQVTVDLSLENQSSIKGIQTDIEFDPAVASFVGAAASGRGLGMTAAAQTVASGRARIVLHFENASVVSAGTGAVATLTFSLTGGSGSSTALTPSGAVLSDVNAQSVTVEVVAGQLTVSSSNPTSAAEYTTRGWQFFGAGNLTAALSDFAQAITLDSSHGPAHVGQGWARLGMATSSSAMNNAVASFDSAFGLSESGAEVYAGRAAASLGAGGSSLSGAVTDAQTARTTDPGFIFQYRSSFDVKDLHLIEAFAQAGMAGFSQAISAADQVASSEITEGNSGSWVVDGTTYSSFEGAVLAYLHKLSIEFSG